MRTFILVAAHSSFAAAARELGLSPSAVSKQIGALEERLDVKLLQRTTRQVALTQAGRAYLERAQSILADLEDLEMTVRGLHSEPRGTLRVTAPQEFGRLFLCDAVATFAATYPHLRIELELADRKVDVVDGGYDVAIRVAKPTSSTLVMRRLGRCQRILCASPAYVEAHGRPATPAALSDHECIEYDYAESNAWSFRVDGRLQTVAATGRLRANAAWAIRSLALAGQGIALLPLHLVVEDVEAGRLVGLLDDVLDADLDVMALLPPGDHVSAKARVFVDFIAAHLQTKPWRVLRRVAPGLSNGARPQAGGRADANPEKESDAVAARSADAVS